MIKRRISEIEATARLEPETGILLTEGTVDKNVIRSFIRDFGSNWAVYDCSAIEDDLNVAPKRDFRTLLVNIADRFNKLSVRNIICIIDADFDIIEENPSSYEQLLKTDLASLPLYGFGKELFKSIERMTGIHISNDEIACITLSGRTIFSFRYEKRKNKLNHELPALDKVLVNLDKGSAIALEDYETRLMHLSKGSTVWKGQLQTIVSSLPTPSDPREHLNDHDVAYIVSAVLKKKANKQIFSEQEIIKLMAGEIRPEVTKNAPMFQNILAKVTIPVAPPPPAPAPAA